MILNERKVDAPSILAENVGPQYQKLMPVIWALRDDHPGFRYHRAFAVRAVTLSDLLGARPRTIEKHVEGILAKLGVENRVTAALVATQAGL